MLPCGAKYYNHMSYAYLSFCWIMVYHFPSTFWGFFSPFTCPCMMLVIIFIDPLLIPFLLNCLLFPLLHMQQLLQRSIPISRVVRVQHFRIMLAVLKHHTYGSLFQSNSIDAFRMFGFQCPQTSLSCMGKPNLKIAYDGNALQSIYGLREKDIN